MTKFTPKPLPVPLAMSTANHETDATPASKNAHTTTTGPDTGPSMQTPSPLPVIARSSEGSRHISSPDVGANMRRPLPNIPLPVPRLRIHCEDLRHPGARAFFRTIDPSSYLDEAVQLVLTILYGDAQPEGLIPPTRSITLVLKSKGGVAETGGIDLDDDHKEVSFSLGYIEANAKSHQLDRVGREIKGVLVHEIVHAWQWNGKGRAPVGLIEGIADFVRLKAALDPPHWKREAPKEWDAGYDKTAFFLDWLEKRNGAGSVRRLNLALKDEYREHVFWKALFDKDVDALFKEYTQSFDKAST